jgi:hypothetical protein
MHPTPYITQEGIPMAIAEKNTNSEDDFLKVGPDATATFDASPSTPTEHASSENLWAAQTDEDDLEEEEEEDDEEDDDEDEEEDEEELEDDDIDDEVEDEEDEDDEIEGDDHDLAKGPKPPSVYRKV